VPREKVKDIMDRYNKLLDTLYGQLNARREEQEMTAFRSRIQTVKADGGDSGVRRERNFLRDKMERLRGEIRQYENNMGFFTGKGAENMRKEIEKKIKNAEREIEDLKKKIALMDGQ
jgi:chromosome segregation ATPase